MKTPIYLRINKMVVIGGGGHARVLMSILKKNNMCEIIGYTDVRDNGDILGVPHIGDDSILDHLISTYPGCSAAIGIGVTSPSADRMKIMNRLEQLGFMTPAIISSDAIVNENVNINQATVVFDGAVINTGTRLGKCCIINTNSTIEHDCEIGDYVHIAPGATLSGGVKIGGHSFVGAGAVIIHGTTIGDNVIIGAGAVVIRDCRLPGTYVGAPARRIK